MVGRTWPEAVCQLSTGYQGRKSGLARWNRASTLEMLSHRPCPEELPLLAVTSSQRSATSRSSLLSFCVRGELLCWLFCQCSSSAPPLASATQSAATHPADSLGTCDGALPHRVPGTTQALNGSVELPPRWAASGCIACRGTPQWACFLNPVQYGSCLIAIDQPCDSQTASCLVLSEVCLASVGLCGLVARGVAGVASGRFDSNMSPHCRNYPFII